MQLRPTGLMRFPSPQGATRRRYNPPPMSGDRIKLQVRERDERGSRNSRRLRAQGLIPGVLYGNGEAQAIVVPERELRSAVTGPSGLHTILDVVVEGKQTVHPSVLADLQTDPIRGTVAHIDLREVRLDQPIQASVVVQLVGEPEGVKVGGVLSLVNREVHVEALPGNIPDHIDAEVSFMEIGDVLRLEDLPSLENVTFLDDPHETVIATVSAPRVEVEPEVEEAEGEEIEGEAVEGEPEEDAGEASEGSADEAPAEE
jgi:large subunit ribosomal protein L25